MYAKKRIIIAIITVIIVIITVCFFVVCFINSPQQRLIRHIRIARECIENGDYTKAIYEFKVALEFDPTSVDVYREIVTTYIEIGDKMSSTNEEKEQAYMSAISFAEDIMNINSENETVQKILLEAYIAIADFYFNVSDFDKAVSYYKIARDMIVSESLKNIQEYAASQLSVIETRKEERRKELVVKLNDEVKLLNKLRGGGSWSEVTSNKTTKELANIHGKHINAIEEILQELGPSKDTLNAYRALRIEYRDVLKRVDDVRRVSEKCYEITKDDIYIKGGTDEYGELNEFGNYVKIDDTIFEYDGLNLVRTQTDSLIHSYEYDDGNRMVSLRISYKIDITPNRWTVTYSDFGAIALANNGDREVMTFDKYGRIISTVLYDKYGEQIGSTLEFEQDAIEE